MAAESHNPVKVRGVLRRWEKESWTEVIFLLSDQPGGTEPTPQGGSKKTYILTSPPSLTSCWLSLWPNPLKTKGQGNLLLSGELPPRATNRRQKREGRFEGRQTLNVRHLIYDWPWDTLNTSMNGCTDLQFPTLCCFFITWSQYFLAEYLH